MIAIKRYAKRLFWAVHVTGECIAWVQNFSGRYEPGQPFAPRTGAVSLPRLQSCA